MSYNDKTSLSSKYATSTDVELKQIYKSEAEEKIRNFSGYEVVIASTNFLTCALANDSGAGHMLSTNYCPLINKR